MIVCPSNLNGRFAVSAVSDIALRIALSGSYEPELTELLNSQTKILSGDVINIGANIGLLAIHVAKTFDCVSRVYAIEPSPEAFRLLQYNINQNGCASKIHAIKKCVSNRKGFVDFSFIQGMPEYSSIGGIVHKAVIGREQIQVQVETATLADILVGLDVIPSMIVIDVEGAEKLVLDGASGILDKYHPVVIFKLSAPLLAKYSHRVSDIVTLLEGIGYKTESAFDGRKIDENFDGEAMAVFRK